MQPLSQQEAWEQIRQSVFRIAGEIRYGKVEITIHEGDIVQVEVTEKFRQPAGQAAGRNPEISADRTTGSTSYSTKRSSSK